MYTVRCCFMVAAAGFLLAGVSSAEELMVGCRTRPSCGKVCKLVCDSRTLVSICYGSECATICVPGPSKPGCKHCESTCCGCGTDDSQAYAPKCEFCWRDWVACGCATPRTVKVLTKYQAEKQVAFHHWEVVEAGDCGCAAAGHGNGNADCLCVYKPAPAEAQLGDVLALSAIERERLAHALPGGDQSSNVALASAVTDVASPQSPEPSPPAASDSTAEPAEPTTSIWHRMARAMRPSIK